MSAQAMCSCLQARKNNKGKKTESISAKLFPTIADEEDICIYCGYYVVWKSNYDLYPKSNKGIGGYVKVASQRVPERGWNQKQIINYFENPPGGYVGNDDAKEEMDRHFKRYPKDVGTYNKFLWNKPTKRQIREWELKQEDEE